MSRWWPDKLRIALCPNQVVVVRSAVGWGPRIIEKQVLEFEPGPDDDWHPAIESLQAFLRPGKSARAEVSVVLSNHFVRYLILPASDQLKSRSQWFAYANHRFHSTFGSPASQWSIRVSSGSRGMPRIASAVDMDLIKGIRTALQPSTQSVQSVQPFLMSAYNRMRSRLPQEDVWLLIGEPGRATLAMIANGRWRHVRSRRVDMTDRRALDSLLAREERLLGLDHPCTQVIANCTSKIETLTDPRSVYRLEDRTLSPGSALIDRRFAMAL